ncbi:MAG: VapE family protein, partial [Clostridia bacterium]
MIVLIGSKQGEGKSTLVRWLAMRDDFYADVKQFDGQQGIEELSGAWICEVGELLALTKSREVEAIKSFLTRQCDRCRHPYDHHVSDHPRQCVFIGTTNRRQFLTDKTGNRRFYPVEVHQTGYELFRREAECRADIAQCWAEARAKMDTPFMAAFADQSLSKTIRSLQESAVEDDWRVGVIDEYLRKKMPGERVFAQELRTYALYPKTENLRDVKRESVEIGIIMQDMAGWVREGKASRRHAYPKYGPQKCWIKEPDLVTTMDDDMPF